MIQQTSLEAYKEILPSLGRRQLQVYEIIETYGPLSNKDVLSYLRLKLSNNDLGINQVTPRVKELRDKGLVKEHSSQGNENGRNVMLWVLSDTNCDIIKELD